MMFIFSNLQTCNGYHISSSSAAAPSRNLTFSLPQLFTFHPFDQSDTCRIDEPEGSHNSKGDSLD
jgi:hypothetical protein